MSNKLFSKALIKNFSVIQKISEKGLAPWFKWESENCSFGLCYRLFGFYPRFFPLFINSDHGVHWESKIWHNEKSSSPYFTWNYKKFLTYRNLKLEAYYIKHPWIYYKKKIFNKNRQYHLKQGTIVFFPHSNNSLKPVFDNLDSYFKLLKDLPEKYKPISLILHHYDISKGLHIKLKKYGFNIVTAGHSSSIHFVKRFYDLISLFKYATSPMNETALPSSFFYCIDFGLPYFFLGKSKSIIYSNSGILKKGNIKATMYGNQTDINFLKRCNKLFYYNNFNNELNNTKKKIISEHLGIDSKMSRCQFSIILWKSLFKNIINLNFFLLYFNKIILFFTKFVFIHINKKND